MGTRCTALSGAPSHQGPFHKNRIVIGPHVTLRTLKQGLATVCAVVGPWTIAIAQTRGETGFESYQQAFAEAMDGMNAAGAAPRGAVWLRPDALPGNEGCTSCHLGIADDRFVNARLPYRRHHGHYLADHPPEQFGCTVCHGGIADGLTFAAAGHPPPADPARRDQWRQHYGWQPAAAGGMVPLRYITGRCRVCHQGATPPQGAEPYRVAQRLVAQKRCASCHRFSDEPSLNVDRAVSLDHIGSKVGAAWLRTYLEGPHAYGLPDDQVDTVTAYLLALQDPRIAWGSVGAGSPSNDAAGVGRGLEIVRERRCQTCHDIPGLDDEGFIEQQKVGPSLARVGEKLNPQWIRNWLLNPHTTRSDTGMPRFRFEPGQIDDVTAYLSSLRADGAAAAAPAASTPARPNGERMAALATEYRCTACHRFAHVAAGPPARTDLTDIGPAVFARLAETPPGFDTLEGPQGLFHRGASAPRLFGPGESTEGVLTFLAGQAHVPVADRVRVPATDASPAGFDPAAAAGGLVDELRCLSCHTIRGTGGDTGPDLTPAGSKLKRQWLVSFLQAPQAIRPMNRARMPRLGLTAREAERLADWIVSELTSPAVEETHPDLTSAFSFMGASKFKSPYGCIACHRLGDEGGMVGSELTHVGSRLTTKWIRAWVADPDHWIHDVRMPDFRMNDEDLDAITLFLSEQQ